MFIYPGLQGLPSIAAEATSPLDSYDQLLSELFSLLLTEKDDLGKITALVNGASSLTQVRVCVRGSPQLDSNSALLNMGPGVQLERAWGHVFDLYHLRDHSGKSAAGGQGAFGMLSQ